MSCEGWTETTLGEVFEFSSGLSKGSGSFGFGFPFLSFKTVFNNYFLPEKLEDLVDSNLKEQKKCSIFSGDVFLTRTSETLDELGMSCVALKDYDSATFNGFTKRLRPKSNSSVFSKYLGFYFRSPQFRRAVTGMASMTTRASLNNDMLSHLPIMLPPVDEQITIGNMLYSLECKIELNNRINKTLEEMAQAIFKRWFVDFEFPDDNGNPYKSSGGKMVESELEPIPEGWKIGTIDDLGTIVGGGTPSKARGDFFCESGIPWITPKDLSRRSDKYISHGEIDISDEGYKNSSAKLMPKGTVLFSSRAPIGYLAIALNDVSTNQGFKSIVPDKGFGSEFIYYLMKLVSPDIENQATGSTFKEVSGGELKSFKIKLPDKTLSSNFASAANSLCNCRKNLEKENKTLIQLRDILLPRLMSGEISTAANT